jgi:dihydroxyacid dehydratase/phosphogluconate dehydratase
MLSTQGGIRAADGHPIALGYHTGHWEIGLLMQAAAEELAALGGLPFAGFCSDPCDGRTQGTPGMMDSLAYRNDAAVVLRRLARSLPTRRGVLGVATCDKGLPAMMMALAALRDLPCVLVPGGVTLPPADGEDAGTVQSIGARFAHGELSLERAADLGCRACGSPGGGCQFLGTAPPRAGRASPHTALAPSGQPVWLDMARLGARAGALTRLAIRDIVTDAAVRNAMTCPRIGATNLLPTSRRLPMPRIGAPPSTTDESIAVPRIVDVRPTTRNTRPRASSGGGRGDAPPGARAPRLGASPPGDRRANADWWESSSAPRPPCAATGWIPTT